LTECRGVESKHEFRVIIQPLHYFWGGKRRVQGGPTKTKSRNRGQRGVRNVWSRQQGQWGGEKKFLFKAKIP